MGDIKEELSRKFYRKKGYPRRHCGTCSCNNEFRYSSRVALSTPRLAPINDYPEMIGAKGFTRRRPYSSRLCDISNYLGSTDTGGPGISRYIDKLYYWDQKYSMLENWFKRFDFDNDGYLNVMELQCLLDRLGAPVRHFNVKRIFEQADRDCDGRLSFSEFLLMWRIAASGDISDDGGCNELQAIIRQHQLYPDVIDHSQRKYHHLDPMVGENIMFRRPIERCMCCRYGAPIQETVESSKSTPRSSHTDVISKKEEEKKSKSKTPDHKKKIILSCNRYPIY